MERHGWRAIIYDAPWARFRPDQDGIVISEDGRSCETTSDDKSTIIIEADPNISMNERTNGHVLFRQKGSDLFDIVCLKQDPGGSYEIKVDNLTIDGCVLKANDYPYSTFINNLRIYENLNGEGWKEITGYEDKKNMLVKPTASDAANKYEGVTEIVIKGKYDSSGSSILTITEEGTDIEQYTDDTVTVTNVEKTEPGTKTCGIVKKDGAADKCTGGKVYFTVTSSTISDSVYVITFNVINNYDIYNCGVKRGATAATGSISSCSVKSPATGVSILEHGDNSVKLSVSYGIVSVNLSITTNKGKTKNITISLPQT